MRTLISRISVALLAALAMGVVVGCGSSGDVEVKPVTTKPANFHGVSGKAVPGGSQTQQTRSAPGAPQ